MYVYCVYPVMLKSSKQLPNCVARAEASIVPIVFDDVLYEVRAYTCSNGTSASKVYGLSVEQCRSKYSESMVGIFPFDIFNPIIVYDQMCKIIPWISATSVYIFGMSILRV